MQVTGTPQSILLQSYASGWKPYFIYYFTPGKGYMGGNFFFGSNYQKHIIFTDNAESIERIKEAARAASFWFVDKLEFSCVVCFRREFTATTSARVSKISPAVSGVVPGYGVLLVAKMFVHFSFEHLLYRPGKQLFQLCLNVSGCLAVCHQQLHQFKLSLV